MLTAKAGGTPTVRPQIRGNIHIECDTIIEYLNEDK
jgi:hypothetical protein